MEKTESISLRCQRRWCVESWWISRVSVHVLQAKPAANVSLDEAITVSVDRTDDLVALDDALNSLAELDERKSRIVDVRFFLSRPMCGYCTTSRTSRSQILQLLHPSVCSIAQVVTEVLFQLPQWFEDVFDQ
jgi:hypothetical protein